MLRNGIFPHLRPCQNTILTTPVSNFVFGDSSKEPIVEISSGQLLSRWTLLRQGLLRAHLEGRSGRDTSHLSGAPVPKETIVKVSLGPLYLVRPRSVKGYSELIFKDAAAGMRRTGRNF